MRLDDFNVSSIKTANIIQNHVKLGFDIYSILSEC